MENLFNERRLVFMSGPETGGTMEKLKTAEDLPDTNDLTYSFCKKLIKIVKSGNDLEGDPKKLIQFVNSDVKTKAVAIAKWLKEYGETEGYKLSKEEILSKTKEITELLTPNKNPNLRKTLEGFLQQAVDEGMPSDKEIAETKQLVNKFTGEITREVTKVINSHSIQNVNAGEGTSSDNRVQVIKRYLPLMNKALNGTGIIVTASGYKVEASTNDALKTAEAIKNQDKQKRIIADISRYQKQGPIASK